MIRLTRLNDDCFALNAELIRYVEERPDTIITLTTGDRLTVRESMEEVIRRTVEYHRSKYVLPMPKPVQQEPPRVSASEQRKVAAGSSNDGNV